MLITMFTYFFCLALGSAYGGGDLKKLIKEAIAEELGDDMQGLKIATKGIEASTRFVKRKITPSVGCKSNNAEDDFLPLVRELKLTNEYRLSALVSEISEEDLINVLVCGLSAEESETIRTKHGKLEVTEPYTFQWAKIEEELKEKASAEEIERLVKMRCEEKGTGVESLSYGPFSEYLTNNPRFRSVVVANGQNLPFGHLFKEEVYSLRPAMGVSSSDLVRQRQPLMYIRELVGRVDLILVDKTSKDNVFSRNDVEVAAEIKTVESMSTESKLDESLREACLQLIGLCAANSKKSPPVVLSNLNKKNYVLTLSRKENPEVELRYNLHIWKYDNVNSAIRCATMCAMRPCFTHDFGRCPTRSSSIAEEHDED